MQSSEYASASSMATTDGLGLFSQDAIVSSLSDPSSRAIVLCTMEEGKTVAEISAETGVPSSTCYRRIAELSKDRILVMERMVLTREGKKFARYRCAAAGVHIDVGHGKVSVSVSSDPAVLEKLRSAWISSQFHTTSLDSQWCQPAKRT
jgi:hypothetical protein